MCVTKGKPYAKNGVCLEIVFHPAGVLDGDIHILCIILEMQIDFAVIKGGPRC